jgi:hypothetical protein
MVKNQKIIILIIIIGMVILINKRNLLETFGVVNQGDCTSNDYENCKFQITEEDYGCAHAYANARLVYDRGLDVARKENKLIASYPYYMVGDYRIRYKCIGDEFSYVTANTNEEINELIQIPCTVDGGCPGTKSPLEGYITIKQAPSSAFIPGYILYCFDYDYDECPSDYPDDPYWAKTGASAIAGYHVGNVRELILCYDNGHCKVDEYCDRSGQSNEWKCKPSLCIDKICESYCDNDIIYYNGNCNPSTGQCSYSMNVCELGCKNNQCHQSICNNGICESDETITNCPQDCCTPINGGWTDWNECTVECGGGIQTRTCTNPPPSCGGINCVGPSSKSCNIQICLDYHLQCINNVCTKISGSGTNQCTSEGIPCGDEKINWEKYIPFIIIFFMLMILMEPKRR